MMKKLVACIALLAGLIVLIAGCGGNTAAPGAAGEKKKLKIVTYANWNPFEYLENGKIVGFDVDLIAALAKEAGYEYEITNAGWDAMFEQLRSKTADVGMSGITITDSRKQTFDFSIPYFVSKQSIVVKVDSPVRSGEDLREKMVGVQSGSTGQEAMEKLLGKNNANIKKFKNGLHYMELSNGSIDAAVGDDTNNRTFVSQNTGKGFKLIYDDKTFEPEYFGLMFPKDSKVKADFDQALKKLYDNGTYASLYKKWFKAEPDMDELKARAK